MDPWLEDTAGWPGLHLRLIASIGDSLAASVSPRFQVLIEERIYVTDEADPGFPKLVPDVIVTRRPGKADLPQVRGGQDAITTPLVIEDLLDTEIHDRYIEIRDARSHEVVTAIEVLSPANKVQASRGRQAMEETRGRMRASGVHWMEIDLLHGGRRTGWGFDRDYRVILLHSGQPGVWAWPFGIRDGFPTVAVPLRPPHEDVPLNLGRVFGELYDRARYGDAAEYDREPPPPALATADLAWARERIAAWRAARG
jgi:hypothetical protein